MDVLNTVTKHVLITYVRPNKIVVGLEAIDIMEGDEATAENGETGGGTNAIDGLPLLIGSTPGRKTLSIVIADDCFVDSYLHQSFSYFAVADVVGDIHSQDHLVPIIP